MGCLKGWLMAQRKSPKKSVELELMRADRVSAVVLVVVSVVKKVSIEKQQLETLALRTIQRLHGCWAVVEVIVFPTKFGPSGNWRMAVVNYGGALVSDVNRAILRIQDQLAQTYELAPEPEHPRTSL